MKTIFIIIIILSMSQIFGQSKYIGKYHDSFGSEVDIANDSTFHYTIKFDLISSWSNGKWQVCSDTIFFNVIPVLDTLKYQDSEMKIDTLILSPVDHSETIEPANIEFFALSGFLTQNKIQPPEKMFYKKNKLFVVDKNGRLLRRKTKSILDARRKDHPWYVRTIE